VCYKVVFSGILRITRYKSPISLVLPMILLTLCLTSR